MTQEFINALKQINPNIMDSKSLDLFSEGIIDSLDIMNIMAMLEDNFNIELEVDDLSPENFASPQSIWNLVQRLKEGV